MPQAKRAPQACLSARKAIIYYRRITWSYDAKLGHERTYTAYQERERGQCAYKRYLVSVWKTRLANRKEVYSRYLHDYAWWAWLPDKWQRVGACETGYGKRPGDWKWNSGTYQGAFGFHFRTWDQYKPAGAPSEAYLATPRQQYECALNVKRWHGYGAWGCGGA